MATVVNNPSGTSDNSVGLIVGIVLLLGFVFLLFYYGLPALRGASNPSVSVPSKIDVNVNPGGGESVPTQQ